MFKCGRSVVRYLDRVESVIPPPNGGNNENISKIKLALGLIVLGFIYLILISLYFVLPMALLVVGIVHIHDCPVQDRIPVWMIIVAITIMTWGFLLRLATQYRNAIERVSVCMRLNSLPSFFTWPLHYGIARTLCPGLAASEVALAHAFVHRGHT